MEMYSWNQHKGFEGTEREGRQQEKSVCFENKQGCSSKKGKDYEKKRKKFMEKIDLSGVKRGDGNHVAAGTTSVC